jgi:hypothetical protein
MIVPELHRDRAQLPNCESSQTFKPRLRIAGLGSLHRKPHNIRFIYDCAVFRALLVDMGSSGKRARFSNVMK